MDKIWLEHYPAGVPHEIDPGTYTSLAHLFEASCARFAGRPAFSSMGTTLTYADIEQKTRDFAAYLQHECRLAPGDRVALMMPNVLQYPVALFGALRAGLVVVNCNPLYTPRELGYQLEDSGAKVIVVLENFARTVEAVVGNGLACKVVTTELGDFFPPMKALVTNLVVRYAKKMIPDWHIEGAVGLRAALAAGRKLELRPVQMSRDDIAFLQYTGGTTGVPKGAMLTHGNMLANLQQVSAWMGKDFIEAEEVVVTPLPLYHVFALTVNLLTFVKWGGHNVLIANPRDLPQLVKELKSLRFSVITGVNTLFHALVELPEFAEIDMTALKVAIGGGMPVQRAVAEKWQAITRKPLIEGYGLTETSPIVTANPVSSAGYTGTIGMPLPSTEVSIRDESGVELQLGEIGELCVRGPQVMKGYWRRPDETAKTMTTDGWLRTGDMGYMDERGYVKLTDRKKDMIIVSGFKVFPSEIEEVVMSHPAVREAACIGTDDEHTGQAVTLVVYRKDPVLSPDQLLAWCHKRLTPYKIPKHIHWANEPLPKSPVGKILRRLVRDAIERESASVPA
ncbi:MAG TPA: AMP-binding protein [Casimicrobiaceae bacterium]|nr:AMP-binding protein [Casimicrobiaceae bacterium]